MRDTILRIIKENRNTAMGDVALANTIYQATNSNLNKLTTDPLAVLLSKDGIPCYEEKGFLCEKIGEDIIKFKSKVYEQVI
jgi:hypothetical protein